MELGYPDMVSTVPFDCELLLTMVNVGRFSVSALARIFFVGHSKLNALPAGC
jgi:hypothetical protein